MSNSSSGGLGTKFLLASAAVIIILAGLKAAQSLISPFLLAVFFALILTPPLRWLKKKGLPDTLAIIALSAFVFLLGLGIVLVFSNSLTQFAAKLPDYQKKVTEGYTAMDTWINNVADRVSALGESITQLTEPATELTTELPSTEPTSGYGGEELATGKRQTTAEGQPLSLNSKKKLSFSDVIPVNTFISYVQLGINALLNIATVSTLVLIMLVFMLLEAARMPEKVKEAFSGRDLTNEYFKKIADDTWNYMKIKTIICFLTGLSTSIGLWFLGVEYAILWGLLMFFLNYIPNIGQVIASIPPVLLSLIDGGVSLAIYVTLWLIIVNTFWGIVVEPRYMGSGLGISSLVVLLSLIFWGWLLGPVGMFLSAPLTMVVKIVLQNDPKSRWIAVLLSNR